MQLIENNVEQYKESLTPIKRNEERLKKEEEERLKKEEEERLKKEEEERLKK